MHKINTGTLKYIIEVLETHRTITDAMGVRQEGEEYTAIDECIDELKAELDDLA